MVRYETFRFSLSISAEEYLAYYEGSAQWVQVKSSDGKRVRFPASALRPFVDELGVEGTFEMTIDENNKLVKIHRLDR